MLPCLLAAFNRVDYSLLAIFFSAFMTHLFSTYVSGQSFNVSSLASLPLPSLKMMFLRILSWSLYSLYVLSLGKFIHSHGLSLQSLSNLYCSLRVFSLSPDFNVQPPVKPHVLHLKFSVNQTESSFSPMSFSSCVPF